jgi:hypothetical protein
MGNRVKVGGNRMGWKNQTIKADKQSNSFNNRKSQLDKFNKKTNSNYKVSDIMNSEQSHLLARSIKSENLETR